jgi:multidrug efflux pump subunit AcrA (membrane-fusion protein)
MKRNTLKYTLFILPLLLTLRCKKFKKKETKTDVVETPQVKTTTVHSVKYSEQINTTGRLSFNNEYNLSFKTAGIIETIYVKEGQSVKGGQVLVTLNLNEIEASTSQAKIAVDKAQRDYNRANALYKDSVVTLEHLENTEGQLKTVQNNLDYLVYLRQI